jgi:flagellar hook-basal body complex protein FliE
MSISIQPVNNIQRAVEALSQAAGASSEPGAFQGILQGAINQVENSRVQAEQMARDFITGDTGELHSVALATQRAELEFDLLLQIRNKAVSAYQEVMRMQV